jgi:hypothetical protein
MPGIRKSIATEVTHEIPARTKRQSRGPAARRPQQEDHRHGGGALQARAGGDRHDRPPCPGRGPDLPAPAHRAHRADQHPPDARPRAAEGPLRRRRAVGARYGDRRVRARGDHDTRVPAHARRGRPDGARCRAHSAESRTRAGALQSPAGARRSPGHDPQAHGRTRPHGAHSRRYRTGRGSVSRRSREVGLRHERRGPVSAC